MSSLSMTRDHKTTIKLDGVFQAELNKGRLGRDYSIR